MQRLSLALVPLSLLALLAVVILAVAPPEPESTPAPVTGLECVSVEIQRGRGDLWHTVARLEGVGDIGPVRLMRAGSEERIRLWAKTADGRYVVVPLSK